MRATRGAWGASLRDNSLLLRFVGVFVGFYGYSKSKRQPVKWSEVDMFAMLKITVSMRGSFDFEGEVRRVGRTRRISACLATT